MDAPGAGPGAAGQTHRSMPVRVMSASRSWRRVTVLARPSATPLRLTRLPFLDDVHSARPVQLGVLGVHAGMLLREFGEDQVQVPRPQPSMSSRAGTRLTATPAASSSATCCQNISSASGSAL